MRGMPLIELRTNWYGLFVAGGTKQHVWKTPSLPRFMIDWQT